jgi:outer membrane protein OmpA-like peptidoglycan-associated protein
MKRARFVLALGLAAMSATAAAAGKYEPGTILNFVTCPLIRDTDPTPCWLAEYEGELYYLGLQENTEVEFFPPQQGHKALIEGKVTDKPRICGGIPLEPVVASTLPEIDRSCDQILPADGWVAPEPLHRGVLPRADSRSIQATDIHLPRPPSRKMQFPPPPYEETTFAIPFYFGSEFMVNKATRAIQRAQAYALASKAKKVEIVGYRAGALLSNGKRLEEDRRLPKQRAEKVGEAVRDIGFGDAEIVVRWVTRGEKITGDNDHRLRRVDIIVTPGDAENQ